MHRQLPRGPAEIHVHLLSMFQFTQGMSHSCNEMLAFYIENTCGRTSLMGGTSACGEEKLPFCTKSSEKSISLGNLTVVSLQTKEKKTL